MGGVRYRCKAKIVGFMQKALYIASGVSFTNVALSIYITCSCVTQFIHVACIDNIAIGDETLM